MSGIREPRIVELRSIGPESYGSGYLLGNGIVLTARHVLFPDPSASPPNRLEIEVRSVGMTRQRDDPVLATLEWPPKISDLAVHSPDIALIRVTDPRLTLKPPPLRLIGGPDTPFAPVLKVHAIGFPALAAMPGGGRDTAQLSGVVQPGAGQVTDILQISELAFGGTSGNRPPDRDSDWKGFSGAALFTSEPPPGAPDALTQLVGVVVIHASGKRYDFAAARVDALLDDPAAAALLNQAVEQPSAAVLGMVVRANERVDQSELISSAILREVLLPRLQLAAVPPGAETRSMLVNTIGRLPGSPFVKEAFRAALAGIDPPPDLPALPEDVVEAVADLPPDRSGRSRLELFAAELTMRLTGSTGGSALRAWLDQGGVVALPPPRSPDPKALRPAHGVIEIRRGCPPGFVARAWLCSEGDPICFEPAEVADRRALERCVARTVLAFAQECQAWRRELVLEFLLADELLFAPEAQVERYRIDPSRSNSQLLGTVYPVVLRSHWRAADDMATHFRPNWQAWCELASTKGCLPVRIVTCAPPPRTLYAQLAAQITAQVRCAADGGPEAEAPMTVALAFPPRSGRSRAALDDVLQAGAPIVCWMRQTSVGLSEDDLRTELARLAGGDFHGLPQRLRQRRQEIEGGAEPPRGVNSRDISVIYDAAERSLERLVRAGQLRADLLHHGQAGS